MHSKNIALPHSHRPFHNSLGKPIHASMEGIANFWKWFGNAKTVDVQGRPLVGFHGTVKEFDRPVDIPAFDPKMIGTRWSSDDVGFFFSTFYGIANDYAKSDNDYRNPGSGEGTVYPVYIRCKNPLVIDDPFLQKEGMSPIGVDEDSVTFWDNYQDLILNEFLKPSHDGVLLVDRTFQPLGQPTQTIVAFHPDQIKSAIGNVGLFSKRSSSLSDFPIQDTPSLS